MVCNETYLVPEHRPFDFEWVANVTKAIGNVCLHDPRLVSPENPVLKGSACAVITEEDGSWGSYGPYNKGDVWDRFSKWKLPLVQLLFQFQRPPLGWMEELFSMVHLWGDPIDSIAGLLHTLAHCQSRVLQIRQQRSLSPERSSRATLSWKAATIIAISFDECGRPDKAEEVIEKSYHHESQSSISSAQIVACYEDAARSLAADRATRFLPILLAQAVFIGGFSVAFVKSSSSPVGKGNWVNVEAHSIAFSANYYWAIPVVFLSALIGVSQSEENIPRILSRMSRDIEILEDMHKEEVFPRTSDGTTPLARYRSYAAAGTTALIRPTVDDRIRHGAMYSWRPTRWRYSTAPLSIKKVTAGNPILFALLALVLVVCGFGTAVIVSLRVPPYGSICRPMGHLTMFGTWLVSFATTSAVAHIKIRRQLYLVFVKDLIALGITGATILITQWGIFNRCSCWSLGGDAPVMLPQEPTTSAILMNRIKGEYLYVVLGGIIFELAMTSGIAIIYNGAARVFLQRDDGSSNIVYLRQMSTICRDPGTDATKHEKSGLIKQQHVEVTATQLEAQ